MNEIDLKQKDLSKKIPETPVKEKLQIPYAVLCELTHRCPLSCPYCSNPVELEMKSKEIDTETWKRALCEAVKIGILQAHFSGGEPTARKDLEELIKHASSIGLYTNLITSGVLKSGSPALKLKMSFPCALSSRPKAVIAIVTDGDKFSILFAILIRVIPLYNFQYVNIMQSLCLA